MANTLGVEEGVSPVDFLPLVIIQQAITTLFTHNLLKIQGLQRFNLGASLAASQCLAGEDGKWCPDRTAPSRGAGAVNWRNPLKTRCENPLILYCGLVCACGTLSTEYSG